MGAQRTSFSKLQRDRAKKAKAAAKRERRLERSSGATEEETELDVTVGSEGEIPAGELLKLIEAIHQRFEAGTMTYEQFEEKKTELLARLPVD